MQYPAPMSGKGGTAQRERWPRAFDPHWAAIDDRSLAELLDLACRVAGLVNYYTLDDTPDGDWAPMLTRDQIVTVASIAATDPAQIEARLLALEHRTRAARRLSAKRRCLVALFEAMLDLPRQVDRWNRGLRVWNADGADGAWRATVEHAIARTMRSQVRQLKAYDLGAGLAGALGSPLGLDYSGFTPEWQLEDVVPDASIYRGQSELERIDRALPHLLPVWRTMADFVAGWRVDARQQLARALTGDRLTQPHVALLVAFLRLYGAAQDTLNAIGSRRTDFYYRTVLREKPRPAIPDVVHVAFQCAGGGEPMSVTVPAGTQLAAGKDAAGRDVVYETQEEIMVTSATLERVHTLRVVSAPLAGIPGAPSVPERVLVREIALDSDRQIGWATFGSPDDAPAEIGFAIGASVMRLSSGHRKVRVDIRHAPHAPETLDALDAIAKHTGVNATTTLDLLLAQAFALSVSTPQGWLAIGEYDLIRPPDRRRNLFTLQYSVPAAAPPIAPLAGAPGTTDAPVLRVHLRQQPVMIDGPLGQARVYPLSVLWAMRVTAVQVHVSVAGLQDARVFTPDGQVNPATVFPAFGAMPAVGSAMRIAHDELFTKNVDSVTLRISWSDLPANRTGFAGYYRGYVVDPDGAIVGRLFDNRSFRAAASIERPGAWMLARGGDDDEIPLFRSVGRPDGIPEPAAPLAPSTTLAFRTTALSGSSAPLEGADRAIRLELRQPPYAFGNSLYTSNMMHAVLGANPGAGSEAVCLEEYAILDDTRRRLQLLLAGAPFGRLAILRSLSPAPSPVRAGRQLQSAYRSVTQAWRAYLGRRPGVETRSDWIVRSQYSDVEEAEVPPLDREAYRRTLQATLQSTLRRLLDEATACLKECLTALEDRVDRIEWEDWQQQLLSEGRESLPQRLARLRDLQQRVAGTRLAASLPALRKCDAVLQAASWVYDCGEDTDQLDGRYARTVRDNLRAAVAMLQSLYESRVKACREEGRVTSLALPNPPYLPQVGSLGIDYTAHGGADFCHLLPFGGWQARTLSEGEPPSLIPRFAHEGNLYLGLSVCAPQVLRLFVQVAADNAPHVDESDVTWEYLSGAGWLPLDPPGRERDATNGLRTSGTIALTIPEIAGSTSTILPDDCLWLRATVAQGSEKRPASFGILPHAVTAMRRSVHQAGDLEQPLPPGRITGLVKPLKGIAGVVQPMASFGGRPAESDRAFKVRVAERLRHRDRAVAAWDYERLILERFPFVLRAHVLPARRRAAGEDPSAGAGHVRIVIVPGPDCPDATDPTMPMASRERLAEMEAAVCEIAGTAVQCHVLNPVYVRIKVSASVRWRDGRDPHACARKLSNALVEYLSPWRDRSATDSDYWTRPEIVHFVRASEDVESIAAITVDYEPTDPDVSEPERCLPTSAPAHDIRTAMLAPVVAVEGY